VLLLGVFHFGCARARQLLSDVNSYDFEFLGCFEAFAVKIVCI